ncbi:hypothetical protein [uncultured Tateyamaria sp.]|uniref:hypothetical protein n=1 Tax=uncultured Tateyamaria sp. TaxID=455651 RepID=UPI00262CD3C4|nr:hypothetical protein [uncultured Tateyamaria sp.]
MAGALSIEYEDIPASLRWAEEPDATDKRARSKVEKFQNNVNKGTFRTWRLLAIKSLHAEALKGIGGSARLFPKIGATEYPIAIFPSAANESLLSCTESRLSIDARPLYPTPDQLRLNKHALKRADPSLSGSQEEYLSDLLLANKIRRPNQPGYALSSLNLNGEGCVTSFNAKVCHYLDNVRSCHHIEYILYKAFEEGIRSSDTKSFFKNMAKPTLLIAKAGESLSVEGAQPLFPLISIQAVVLFRRRGKWRVAYVKRSRNVAVAAGAYQFVPAGGFETIGRFDLAKIEGRERDRIEIGFNTEDALLREFLEELFGDPSMVAGAGTADIDNLPGLALCRDLMAKKILEIRSLGVVFDLVRLRPEFSYLIVLRDEKPGNLTYNTRPLNDGAAVKVGFGYTNLEEANELEAMHLSRLRERVTAELWHESSAG